jgi:hypothetical protein
MQGLGADMICLVRTWTRPAVILSVAVGCFIGGCQRPVAISGGADAAPATREQQNYEHELFSLRLPQQWRVARVEHKRPGATLTNDMLRDAFASVLFEGADGDFFSVLIGAPESEMSSDAWWELRANASGKGVLIAKEQPPCSVRDRKKCLEEHDDSGDYCCTSGDGRLEIGALGPSEIAGHDVLFWFGNTKREHNVNLEVFRELLRGFHAK